MTSNQKIGSISLSKREALLIFLPGRLLLEVSNLLKVASSALAIIWQEGDPLHSGSTPTQCTVLTRPAHRYQRGGGGGVNDGGRRGLCAAGKWKAEFTWGVRGDIPPYRQDRGRRGRKNFSLSCLVRRRSQVRGWFPLLSESIVKLCLWTEQLL